MYGEFTIIGDVIYEGEDVDDLLYISDKKRKNEENVEFVSNKKHKLGENVSIVVEKYNYLGEFILGYYIVSMIHLAF